MLKKILLAAKRPRPPLNKKTLLAVFRLQLIFVGIAFFFVVLDMTNTMHLRANSLGIFLFMALGITGVVYADVKEAGVESSEVIGADSIKHDHCIKSSKNG